MDELRTQAASLGIKVDGRWSQERLQAEIAKAQPKEAAVVEKEVKKVPVKLLYDTWGDNEDRIPAGTVVEFDLDTAKALIASGKAHRADPLPGE